MSQKNRILYVSATAGFFGGVERYIYDSARLLTENGFEVSGVFEHVCGRDAATFTGAFRKIYSPDMAAELRGDEFDLAFIHKVENLELLRQIRRRFASAALIHDHDYYCLRRHKYFPWGRINCHLPFNPIYCSLCSGLLERKNGRFKAIRLLHRMALMREIRSCDACIVLSEHMRNNLLMNGCRAEAIYKLLPFKRLDDLVPTATTELPPAILYAGQLIRGKGVDLLLHALSRLDLEFKAYIVGSGNEEARLKKMSAGLGLNGKVVFSGWQSNVVPYFDRAAVVAFPSRWQEPFGLIGIEAFARRKPVVAFAVGGVGEWLADKCNGILVREKDVAGLAAGLKLLLQDPELASRLGGNGREFVRTHCSEEKFIAGFKLMLDKILNHDRAGKNA